MFLAKIQEKVVHHVISCSSWRYEVYMFASSCNLPWTKSNRRCKDKYWSKFLYSCIQFFFSFSDSVNTTSAHHHCFLEWLWGIKNSQKFELNKNRKIRVQITSQQENLCLTSSFAVTVLLLCACEHCHRPGSSLPTNVILIKLSFWRSVYVEYCEIMQHNEILQFL